MNAENIAGLDKAAQVAIGNRLEMMYHSATAMHDICRGLMESCESPHMLLAVREMAKSQARELETLAEKLTGERTGFFESHFGEV